MQEPIDELLEWLHTFDDLQFSCNHRNVIEKIWQIKSEKQFAIPVVSQRSELLRVFDSFYDWHKNQGYVSVKRDDFEEYLKTLNCG
jgi:hypothetical protein